MFHFLIFSIKSVSEKIKYLNKIQISLKEKKKKLTEKILFFCCKNKIANHVLFFILLFLFSEIAESQNVSDTLIINEIQITGNRKTKDFIILRELTFKKNDTVSSEQLQEKLEESKINLLKTPLFNFVEISSESLDSAHVKIIINVTERWYFWPQAALYYADRNFSNWLKNKDLSRTDLGLGLIKYNFRGRNEKLTFYTIFGYDEELILNYEHFYFDKNRRHSGAVYLKQLKRKETGCIIENDQVKRIKLTDEYALKAYNISFRYQFRKEIYNSHSLYLGYEHRSLSDSLLACNSFYTVNPEVPVNYFFLKYIFLNDKRDSRIFPLNGHQIKITAVKNGLSVFPESNINSLKIKSEFSKYTKLNSKFYLGNHLTLQKTIGNRNPFFLNTALGYSSNIRAYEYFAVNGRDFILVKNTLNFELLPKKIIHFKFIPRKRFNTPFIQIFTDIFTDFAYVKNNDTFYLENNTLANTPLFSAGLGINILTYYDWLIRFEYSRNIQNYSGFYLHFEAPF